ncbi:hypothetical protein BaRGS_00036990, partial [Batillaria attramentaria]
SADRLYSLTTRLASSNTSLPDSTSHQKRFALKARKRTFVSVRKTGGLKRCHNSIQYLSHGLQAPIKRSARFTDRKTVDRTPLSPSANSPRFRATTLMDDPSSRQSMTGTGSVELARLNV